MAELLANSPTAGKREAIGKLAAELKAGAKGGKTLKLVSAPAATTGLTEEGETRLVIGGEVLMVKTPGEGLAENEFNVVKRGLELYGEESHPAGAEVFAVPTRAAIDARVRPVLEGTTALIILKELEVLTSFKAAGQFRVAVNAQELAAGAKLKVNLEEVGTFYELIPLGPGATEIGELEIRGLPPSGGSVIFIRNRAAAENIVIETGKLGASGFVTSTGAALTIKPKQTLWLIYSGLVKKWVNLTTPQ